MSLRIVVCASSEGSGFEAIADACAQGKIPAQVVGLIASRAGIGAIEKAKRLNITHIILSKKDFKDELNWDDEMFKTLKIWRADWVVLAGFLSKVGPKVLQGFKNHIVNSHPSLLPSYGGAGMYGLKVHRAVLEAKEKETGVTIHLVDENYDGGFILEQARVKVLEGDTADSLQSRLKKVEHALYIRVLAKLLRSEARSD